MKKHFVLLISFLLLAAVPLMAKGAGDADAGKAVFDKTCKACHGPTGEGNPAMVKASKGEMTPLSAKEAQSMTDDQLKKRIAGHKKPIKVLADKDAQDVVAFVRTLAKK